MHDQITTVESQQVANLTEIQITKSLGYEPQLRRNRNIYTILFQSLAIAAVPYGESSSLVTAIYGGGPLTLFVGLLFVLFFDGCVALSLSELASRYPTSGGPYYWTFQLMSPGPARRFLSYLTGWVWLVGNWTISLSVNFGCASMIASIIAIAIPEFQAESWQILLIFFAMCALAFLVSAFGDEYMRTIDTVAAVWIVICVLAVLLALVVPAKAGRHSTSYAIGHYDGSLSGWSEGFSFFIGLLPPAYTFSAIGMVSSMAEECANPQVQLPKAMSLVVPIGGVSAVLFVLPICFTLPPLQDILTAPYGQAMPYILHVVTGSVTTSIACAVLIFISSIFCSISITTVTSRCTWAFSRDNGLPFARFWSKTVRDIPLPALCLATAVELLLGLIYLGNSTAFTGFASVGVISLSVGYLIPISVSLWEGRQSVKKAAWNCGNVLGPTVNVLAILWILFELVLFTMPTTLPITLDLMSYASAVFVGLSAIGVVWYLIYGSKNFEGPPIAEDLD